MDVATFNINLTIVEPGCSIVKDKVLLRVAGFYQGHDDYQHNLYNASALRGGSSPR
jgi:hypothetical protein